MPRSVVEDAKTISAQIHLQKKVRIRLVLCVPVKFKPTSVLMEVLGREQNQKHDSIFIFQ